MNKNTVVEHFGNQVRVAAALGVTKQAVSAWSDVIPELYALRLEKITEGALEYRETCYREDPE